MRSGRRRSLYVIVAAAAALAVGATTASAAPPPATTTPMECFNQWANNPDYVGDGWVQARVRDTNGVFLGCGDELSGMIHIAHPDSTGTIHPVYAETERAFLECFDAIAVGGAQRPDDEFPEFRTRYEYTYTVETPAGPIAQTATIIKENDRRFVWTMFTSTSFAPEGNDWANCQGVPAR